jgi:hypothetical protein
MGCIWTHFGLLRRARHDKQLGGWVRNFNLSNNGSSIWSNEKSTKVIDDQFVPSYT